MTDASRIVSNEKAPRERGPNWVPPAKEIPPGGISPAYRALPEDIKAAFEESWRLHREVYEALAKL